MSIGFLLPQVVPPEPTTGVRCAVRFPLHLSARVIAKGREHLATTENISASGVLFRLDERLEVETPIEFLVEIPAEVLNGQATGAIHCSGRIVRSFNRLAAAYAAAVIDEYRFQ